MNEEVKLNPKTKKIILISIVAIVALIVIIFTCVEISNKNAVIDELTADATKQGLEDFTISVKGKNSYGDYNVVIECDELKGADYEKMYQIVYYVYSGDAEVTFVVDGDRYQKGLYKLLKNGETVYTKKSSSSSHTCEECSRTGTHSYTSPFSGEKEWYCDRHYEELQDLLGQFGMD